jgi:hypothetical protein
MVIHVPVLDHSLSTIKHFTSELRHPWFQSSRLVGSPHSAGGPRLTSHPEHSLRCCMQQEDVMNGVEMTIFRMHDTACV